MIKQTDNREGCFNLTYKKPDIFRYMYYGFPGSIGFRLVIGKKKQYFQDFKRSLYPGDNEQKELSELCHAIVDLLKLLEKTIKSGKLTEVHSMSGKTILKQYKIPKTYRIERLNYVPNGR